LRAIECDDDKDDSSPAANRGQGAEAYEVLRGPCPLVDREAVGLGTVRLDPQGEPVSIRENAGTVLWNLSGLPETKC